jgi:hypothetical protein
MQLRGGPALDYQPGEAPPGSVHLYAMNLGLTESEDHIDSRANDGARLVVSMTGGAAEEANLPLLPARLIGSGDW